MPAILLALLLSIAAFAQSSAGGGSIQGTVKDPTGAVLPGAKLAIRHQASGLTTATVTNAEGFFVTPPLNIGLYKVRVEMAGMKAWEGELTLETGKIAVIEPVLTPGQVTETVQVTDAIPLVNTTDPTDASTLDSQRIKELPINTGSFGAPE